MPESGERAFQAEGTANATALRPVVFEELQGDPCVCVCVCACVCVCVCVGEWQEQQDMGLECVGWGFVICERCYSRLK